MSDTLPSGLTTEYDCRMELTCEKSAYYVLTQADHKLEISFQRGTKLYYYETSFSDLIKILEDADENLKQSRKLMSYKD